MASRNMMPLCKNHRLIVLRLTGFDKDTANILICSLRADRDNSEHPAPCPELIGCLSPPGNFYKSHLSVSLD